MMRNFTNENFERFLRQNADGLHMQPSAKVWKGISGDLNRRRRRFGFIAGAFLLLTIATGYYNNTSQTPDDKISTSSQLEKDPAVHAGSLNSIAIDQTKKTSVLKTLAVSPEIPVSKSLVIPSFTSR